MKWPEFDTYALNEVLIQDKYAEKRHFCDPIDPSSIIIIVSFWFKWSLLHLRTTSWGWLHLFKCWWRGRQRQIEWTPLFFSLTALHLPTPLPALTPPHHSPPLPHLALECYLSHAFLVKGSTDGLLALTVIWCKCDLTIRWDIAVGSLQPFSCRRTTGTRSFTKTEEMRHIKKEEQSGEGKKNKTFFIFGRQNTHFTPERICLFAVVLIRWNHVFIKRKREKRSFFHLRSQKGIFSFLFPLCESGGAVWFCLSGFLHFKETQRVFDETSLDSRSFYYHHYYYY